MSTDESLTRGREAYDRQAWTEAFGLLARIDRETALELDDLERLAMAAYLTGNDDDALWIRAYRQATSRNEPARAARLAFWLGFDLLDRGEMAQGGAWLARAAHLLADAGVDCVEHGYLLVPEGIRTFEEGDVAGAHAVFHQAAEIATRFRDHDLMAMAALGRGSSLIWLGEPAEGRALLDEAMVSVTAGEVSALVAGIIYCGVIEACWDNFDVGRAAEWTAALSRWCDSMPEMLPYRGHCLVHRAEIMQLHGEWHDAREAARRAGERLSGRAGAGAAFYQEAEVDRLQGRFIEAEEAYRRAGEYGLSAQPGLARLRLVQGRVDAAAAAIRRVLDEAGDRITRARTLGAYVDIMLAVGDVAAAGRAAAELVEISTAADAPLLRATAAYAEGAVRLAEGDHTGACETLGRSVEGWRRLGAPYETARARSQRGLACRELGDEDGGRMELLAAVDAFRRLGAGPDVERTERLCHATDTPARGPGGLTSREVEVLVLVATGRTNRAIAAELVISEKTVARHLSNLFTKLGVTSRSAATAFAYEHGLVQPGGKNYP